ncbi:hypothetical protein DAI22_09g129750 [Oryza sativa Japonica Group]|nr:hypothetical protein DAI22_09g129750 [Oryza sativa Japonica Group]
MRALASDQRLLNADQEMWMHDEIVLYITGSEMTHRSSDRLSYRKYLMFDPKWH